MNCSAHYTSRDTRDTLSLPCAISDEMHLAHRERGQDNGYRDFTAVTPLLAALYLLLA